MDNDIKSVKSDKSAERILTGPSQSRPKASLVGEHIYRVEGMHCASCEILIEKKLLDLPNIKAVDATAGKGEVVVEYEGDRPNPERLNKIFTEENYKFSDTSSPKLAQAEPNTVKKTSSTLVAFNIAIFIIIGFLVLQKMGVSGLLNVRSGSSLFSFFGLGILAGISSCAALVGGMILSMSKQWYGLYSEKNTIREKMQPHIMFNAGRLISYGVLGAVLGIIGNSLQISFKFTSFLIIAISFLMIALGLQMLGVRAFRKFQLTLPKFVTRHIANEGNFQGKYMPFIMGALTFFLPCGFTITAQGMALLSGSVLQGALIMLAFALGTAPTFLFIGLSSVKFSSKPHLAEKFSKVAGFLVLFFALFNLSTQMNVLGFTPLESLRPLTGQAGTNTSNSDGLPEIVDGKQIVKMDASASGYSPNYLKVRAGVPVRWEITDKGTSGCTNAIISKSLFDGSIALTPGTVSIKEFTSTKPGKYKFSCWMGMVSGIIEVIDTANASTSSSSGVQAVQAITTDSQDVIPSGATGCGCGGGGENSCGG